jgi:hypothetical protein
VIKRAAALALLGLLSVPIAILPASLLGAGPLPVGFVFGALLAGYLWRCQGVRSPARLAGLILTSGAAFILAMLAAILLGFLPDVFARSSAMGPGPTQFFFAGAVGATLVTSAFLALLPSAGQQPARAFVEVASCAAAGAVLAPLGSFVDDRVPTVMGGSLLVMIGVWQAGIAFLLVIVAELRAADRVELQQPLIAPPPRPLSAAAQTLFAVVLTMLVLGGALMAHWRAQSKASMARHEQAIAASLAEAPPRENLPRPQERPLEEALVLHEIGRVAPEGTGNVRREAAADHPPVPGHAPPPERLEYYVSYRGRDHGGVTIWQYPNAAWARYELRHIGFVTEMSVNRQIVLASELEYFWYSGASLIRVSAQPSDARELLKAYLAKYPSSVEPSFPLLTKRAE